MINIFKEDAPVTKSSFHRGPQNENLQYRKRKEINSRIFMGFQNENVFDGFGNLLIWV